MKILLWKRYQILFGGTCEKSTSYEDRVRHIDFWWESPKKGRIGVDVKGRKKDKQSDKKFNDDIHWIEMKNVVGNKGWVYGDAEYIAFRTSNKIVFVKTKILQEYAEKVIEGKECVYGECPKDFYIPYTRKDRQDVVFKCPVLDLINISDFIIDCKDLKEC